MLHFIALGNLISYLLFKGFYPCLFVKFVTDGHTEGRKWLTGCGELAGWIFFMGVSILITSGWANDSNISLALLCRGN